MSALFSTLSAGGTPQIDPRNRDVKVWVNGALVHRDEAKVSVYDAGFMLGDGIWEGLRLKDGVFLFLTEHLRRLEAGARTLRITLPPREALVAALRDTATANGMRDGVHARLMVTRGPKLTPDQDPRLSVSGPTVVIIAEHKDETPDDKLRALKLVTVSIRRGLPDTQDPKLNSHSKLNCILAMLQAMDTGADEALMLDVNGFVCTCNSTHFFIVREGEVWTSTGDYCLPGITRQNVIDVCRRAGITVRERNFSLYEVFDADEAFVTGTTGGQTPVTAVDGRTIGTGAPGPMLLRIRALYRELLLERIAAAKRGEILGA